VKLASSERITIGPLASTRRACANAALDTQEQQYLAALDLVRTYRVTGDSLSLLRTDGTIGATYVRTTR
jgi:putative lipoprotein